MKDDTQRIASYTAKTVATTVGLKVAAVLPGMKSSFATKCATFVTKEIAIVAVLNADGTVPTIQYPFYLNFGRELWGMHERGIVGPGLTNMAISLEVKYASYGMTAVLLKKIALDVFTIVIP